MALSAEMFLPFFPITTPSSTSSKHVLQTFMVNACISRNSDRSWLSDVAGCRLEEYYRLSRNSFVHLCCMASINDKLLFVRIIQANANDFLAEIEKISLSHLLGCSWVNCLFKARLQEESAPRHCKCDIRVP